MDICGIPAFRRRHDWRGGLEIHSAKVRSRSLLLVAAVPVYQLIMAACFFMYAGTGMKWDFPGAVLLSAGP